MWVGEQRPARQPSLPNWCFLSKRGSQGTGEHICLGRTISGQTAELLQACGGARGCAGSRGENGPVAVRLQPDLSI